MAKVTICFGNAVDFQKVNDAARPHLFAICRRVLPDGEKGGDEYVALNPIRNDQNLGSFKINLKTGCWADFASNDKGSDIISLVAYLYEVNQHEAAQMIEQLIGVKNEE